MQEQLRQNRTEGLSHRQRVLNYWRSTDSKVDSRDRETACEQKSSACLSIRDVLLGNLPTR